MDAASQTAPAEQVEFAMLACPPPTDGFNIADGDNAIGINV